MLLTENISENKAMQAHIEKMHIIAALLLKTITTMKSPINILYVKTFISDTSGMHMCYICYNSITFFQDC